MIMLRKRKPAEYLMSTAVAQHCKCAYCLFSCLQVIAQSHWNAHVCENCVKVESQCVILERCGVGEQADVARGHYKYNVPNLYIDDT